MAFILIAFGGSYEDAWRTNVVVSRDLQKIEMLQAELELKNETINNIRIQLEAFASKWDLENPFDYSIQEKTKDFPNWVGAIDRRFITEEMKEERKAVINFNAEVNTRNSARLVEYRNKKIQAEKEFLKSINAFDVISETEIGYRYSISYDLFNMTNHNYEIEEVREI